jgi:lactate racemase
LKTVRVPTRYWHGKNSLTLKFPERWGVQTYHMKGYNAPRLLDRQIQTALAEPSHSDTLNKLASKRTEAVVLFDDVTRPTQCSRIVPHVLTELAKGGISDDHIRFVAALGAHSANNRVNFANKLGEEVVERYPIYNHNPFGNLRDIGMTKRGTPVQINEEVMACDLKIGIGCIIPHSMADFSGGGKIVLPGVASIEGICHNHCDIGGECFGHVSPTGFGPIENNASRADIDEAATMAGLDFKIDVIINERGEISGIFAGEPYEEWRRGIGVGKRAYMTDSPADADVVVANAYLKENQAVAAMNIATRTVRDGGTIVLFVNSPEGQNAHYLYGKFGKHLGGKLWARPPAPSKKMTIVVYSHYKERDPLLEIADPEQMIWTRTWNETVEAVAASVKVSTPKVAVFPAAGIQVHSSAYQ